MVGRGSGERDHSLWAPRMESQGLPGVGMGFTGHSPSLAQPCLPTGAVTRRVFTAVEDKVYFPVKEQ